MRQREPVDEEFCRCILEELRDGQTVTVQSQQPEAVLRAIARLGATDGEMERLTIEGRDSTIPTTRSPTTSRTTPMTSSSRIPEASPRCAPRVPTTRGTFRVRAAVRRTA